MDGKFKELALAAGVATAALLAPETGGTEVLNDKRAKVWRTAIPNDKHAEKNPSEIEQKLRQAISRVLQIRETTRKKAFDLFKAKKDSNRGLSNAQCLGLALNELTQTLDDERNKQQLKLIGEIRQTWERVNESLLKLDSLNSSTGLFGQRRSKEWAQEAEIANQRIRRLFGLRPFIHGVASRDDIETALVRWHLDSAFKEAVRREAEESVTSKK